MWSPTTKKKRNKENFKKTYQKIPNKWKSNGIQDTEDPTSQSDEGKSQYDSCVPDLKNKY